MLKRAVRSLVRGGWLVAAVLAVSPLVRADDVAITPEARTHFAAGVALLKDPSAPRYEEAYREFKAAYAAAPSYKVLGNLGLCAMKIERDQEAIDAYETYLKLAGPELTPPGRQQIETDLLTLKAGVVKVTVSSEPPGATIMDVRIPIRESEVHNSYGQATAPLTLGLRRGHHIVTARLLGYRDAIWEFEASAGDNLPPQVLKLVPTEVTPAKEPDKTGRAVTYERPIPKYVYVSGGVSATLLVAGTVFGLVALKEHSDFSSINNGQNASGASSDRSLGVTLNALTDVSLGVGIVAAGVTTYLLLTRPTVERTSAGSPGAHAVATSGVSPDRLTGGLILMPTWTPKGGGGVAATLKF
jgi:hypothetical protein